MASSDVNRTSYRPDVDLGPIFLAVSWSTLSLAMVMVALRLYLRSQVHANDWDDYLIYLALVSDSPFKDLAIFSFSYDLAIFSLA
jgi:hypothetical protein